MSQIQVGSLVRINDEGVRYTHTCTGRYCYITDVDIHAATVKAVVVLEFDGSPLRYGPHVRGLFGTGHGIEVKACDFVCNIGMEYNGERFTVELYETLQKWVLDEVDDLSIPPGKVKVAAVDTDKLKPQCNDSKKYDGGSILDLTKRMLGGG